MSFTNTITTTLGRQILVAQKHSPAVMFGAGIVGIGASLFMTAKATLKLGDVLDKAKTELDAVGEDETDENKKKRNKVRLSTAIEIAKIYAVPTVVAVGTVGLLTGSHTILSRRNVGLTAAYTVLDKSFRQYRDRVLEELGPEKEKALYHNLEAYEEELDVTEDGEVVTKTIYKHRNNGEVSPYAICFDEGNKNWKPEPFMNQFTIQAKEKFANDMLMARGHLFLSEVYDMLGVERTPESIVVGWIYDPESNTEHDNYVSFGVFRDPHIGQAWANGDERSIWLDFNVDGIIYDLINKKNKKN